MNHNDNSTFAARRPAPDRVGALGLALALRVLGACVVALWMGACQQAHHEEHEEGTFPVTSALRQDTELSNEYVAQIHAVQHIELRALEEGYLQDIFVDEGQQIEAGQKMFQIMPLVYQAEVRKAKAEANLARIEYENTKMMADRDIVSPAKLALAKAKLEKAKAEVALAQTHQRLTEIDAPFSGLMGRFHARKGSLLEEGELLTTLADNSTVWVYFNVSEKEYLDYKSQAKADQSMPVKLIMANGQLFDQPGKVSTIEADFNNETGNIAFRATFANPDGLLRHGETGNIVMTVPYRDALLIPQKATFEILDRRFVFVVDEDGMVRSREVTIAAELPQLFVVEEGLEETDKFLLEGLRKVQDGKQIKFEYEDPAEVFEHLEQPAE